jgi:hypothetical protein
MSHIRHAHTKQLIALLLTAVLVFVHITKLIHKHPSHNGSQLCKQEQVIGKAGLLHSCSICEFQLAKDVPFTGEIILVLAPVHAALTYSRLLTSLNSDHLIILESRGPPHA